MINTILIGDVLQKLKEIPDKTVNTCVTSPPYWGLRDYGTNGQIGRGAGPVLSGRPDGLSVQGCCQTAGQCSQ